jgi:hypothetical protein
MQEVSVMVGSWIRCFYLRGWLDLTIPKPSRVEGKRTREGKLVLVDDMRRRRSGGHVVLVVVSLTRE